MADQFTFGDRSDRKAVEVGFDFSPKFDEHGLIPAIAQDHESGQVLMVAYMNDESLRATIEKGEAVYFSRSRQQLWHKGGTSGHVQTVHEILTDCDQDALVVKVTQHGPGSCHAGYQSCFYRTVPEAESAEEGNPLELKPIYSEQSYDPEKVYG